MMMTKVSSCFVRVHKYCSAWESRTQLQYHNVQISDDAVPLSPPEHKKYEWADGVRGIAALAVVIHHTQSAFFGEGESYAAREIYMFPLTFFTRGPQAVHLFFVLSGFVLSIRFIQKLRHIQDGLMTSNEEESDSEQRKELPAYQLSAFQSLASTCCRRFFRLFIPCVIVGWICFFMTEVLHSHTYCPLIENDQMLYNNNWLKRVCLVTRRNEGENISIFRDFCQTIFVDLWVGTRNNLYNKVMWTMSIELKGSILLAFSLVAIANIRYRYQVAAVSFAILLTSCGDNKIKHFASFYAGIMCSLLMANSALHQKWTESNWNSPAVRISLVFFSLCTVSMPNGAGSNKNYYTWLYKLATKLTDDPIAMTNRVGAFLLILTIYVTPSAQRILMSKFIRFLGKISFLLYLTHFEVIFTLGVRLAYHLTVRHVMSFTYARWCGSILSIFVSLIVGYIATIAIDEPTQRLLRRMEMKTHLLP